MAKDAVITGSDQKDDILQGGDGNDLLRGLGGNDRLYGRFGKDNLIGGDGNDLLDGGFDADRMEGGRGNDTYVVDNLGDQVIETTSGVQGGIDTVLSSVNWSLAGLGNVENLTLTGSGNISGTGNTLDNVIIGNAGANTLTGGNGADRLDGGLGEDRMYGGYGNDVYIVDNAADQAIETRSVERGGGIDLVQSSVGFALGAYVENLTLTGSADNGIGNGLDNLITGNDGPNWLQGLGGNDSLKGGAGNDTLEGGTGADAMNGGSGDDVYYVDDAKDVVTELLTLAGGGGIDTVVSDISYALGANLDNLTLTGSDDINGGGNEFANVIIGNGGANSLFGGRGSDVLRGGAGDTLRGEAGNDTLVVDSLAVKEIHGGANTDKLNLDLLTGRIDLRGSLGGSLGAAIKDVEIIDLSGIHANTLALDAKGVAALGESNPTAEGGKTVVVTGDLGDRLYLSAADGWLSTAALQVPYGLSGQYNKIFKDNVTLLVESDVQVMLTAPVKPVPTLDALNGSNGFTIDGIDRSFGASVGGAGDVNGDGRPDLIVGAWQTGGDFGGGASVVFGQNAFPAHVKAAELNGSNGFSLNGVEGFTGWSVASAGDLNGDGYGDVVVGAPLGNPNDSGASYVVFGHGGNFSPPDIDLTTLNGFNGFRIDGVAADDRTGWSVSSAGDLNGDGYQDLIVGAYGPDPLGLNTAGSSYVLFGHAGGFAPVLNLASLDGKTGFRIDGATADQQAGISVSSAGDVNGDGIDDLIVGSALATDDGAFRSGAAYVVFGHAGSFNPALSIGALDGSNGFAIGGNLAQSYTGDSVSGVGDINGDGFADVVVAGNSADSTAVIFGHAGKFGAEVDIGALAPGQGFRFIGGPTDLQGQGTWNVSSAGDVNGDGYDDLVIGIPGTSPDGKAHAGQVFVVFGKESFSGPVDLDHLTTATGFKINGPHAEDHIGTVAGAGDLNGDGFDDILIGGDTAQGGKGAAYVIYGGNFSDSAIFVGLQGTSADEAFVGSAIDNVVYGGGGRDSYSMGAGNDQVYIEGPGLLRADGGAGNDAAFLNKMGATIDLTGDLQGRFSGFEQLNLAGGFQNTLKLDAQAVQDLVGGELSLYGPNTLFVDGDNMDKAVFTSDWAVTYADGARTVLSHGALTVIVASHMQLSIEGPAAAPPVDLTKLDGSNGFKVSASTLAAASAGDINGDGYDDLIIGANQTTGTLGYILYGNGKFFPAEISAKSAGDATTLTTSENGKNAFAWSVSSAGDLNGDGYDDVIVGTPFFGSQTFNGTAHVVFGSAAGLGSAFDLAGLNGSNGFKVTGTAAGDQFGSSVAAAGDVNGDGYDDMLVGSMGATANVPGQAYLLFGHAGAFTANITAANLDGSNGVLLTSSTPATLAGHSVAGAGDFNGDGYDDVIIGARGGATASGESFVVFGHAGAFGPSLNLDTLNGTNGFKIQPISVTDGTGMVAPGSTNVASAGDLNGDGLADLVIGVYAADPSGRNNAGSTYVVFGQAGPILAPLNLNQLDAAHGFRIDGAAANDAQGWSVAGAGDFNGDGYADLIVSSHLVAAAPNGSGNVGEADVVFGHEGGFGNIDLANLSGAAGFQIAAPNGSIGFGMTVASAGDVNGDGFSDLAVSDYGNSATYVLFGHETNDSVDQLGDAGGSKFFGTKDAETFVAGNGDDALDGGGGRDSLQGGGGNDRITVSDRTFLHVDGGGGDDTLFLNFSGPIDFRNLDGDPATLDRGKITGIETIDLQGFGIAATLHLGDVLDINPDNHDVGGNPNLDNVLKIDGDAGDTLRLFTTDGWGAGDTGSLAGYAVYSSQGVQVAVDTAIQVTVV